MQYVNIKNATGVNRATKTAFYADATGSLFNGMTVEIAGESWEVFCTPGGDREIAIGVGKSHERDRIGRLNVPFVGEIVA